MRWRSASTAKQASAARGQQQEQRGPRELRALLDRRHHRRHQRRERHRRVDQRLQADVFQCAADPLAKAEALRVEMMLRVLQRDPARAPGSTSAPE
jgi:hypothetical protein